MPSLPKPIQSCFPSSGPKHSWSWLLERTAPAPAAAVLCGMMLVGAGCASMKPTQSGFLSSYAGMTNGASDNVRQLAPAPNALTDIESILVDRPRWLATSGGGASFEQEQRDSVLAALENALKEELGKLKPVKDRGGERPLVVRAAVTDAARSNPAVNVATSLLLGPVTNGGATIEIEAVDPDGRQFAAMVFADTGGILDVFHAYSESGHSKAVTQRAAREFRGLLERSEKTGVPDGK